MIRDIALLAARLAVGAGIAAHGSRKAFGWFAGPGPEATAARFHQMGLRPGETMTTLSTVNELGGGTLIALGLGGPLGPAMLLADMIVASGVTVSNGFFAQQGGVEPAALYGAAALALAAGDYGPLSLDALLGSRTALRGNGLTLFCLAGATAAAALVLSRRDATPPGPAQPTFRGKNSPLPEAAPA